MAVEWKTSNGIYPGYAIQVAAYAKALEEMTREEANEAWILGLGERVAEFAAKRVQDLGTGDATGTIQRRHVATEFVDFFGFRADHIVLRQWLLDGV